MRSKTLSRQDFNNSKQSQWLVLINHSLDSMQQFKLSVIAENHNESSQDLNWNFKEPHLEVLETAASGLHL